MPTPMVTYHARWSGSFVARCPRCDAVCAYWEDEDLDEDGHLLCYCDGPTAEHYDLASRDASLGVGHIWTATACPAYRTFNPADCICRR